MATVEEVERILFELISRLQDIDPRYRPMLPSRRTIEASCEDLGLIYHAYWRHGKLSDLHPGAADRPDIRVTIDSDDLVQLSDGELTLREAYIAQRLRIDASMTDLMRLSRAL